MRREPRVPRPINSPCARSPTTRGVFEDVGVARIADRHCELQRLGFDESGDRAPRLDSIGPRSANRGLLVCSMRCEV